MTLFATAATMYSSAGTDLGRRQNVLAEERLQPDGLQRESGRYNTAGDVIQDGLQES
jgi:hypothetical protein